MQQTNGGPTTSTTRPVEFIPTVSHELEVTGECRIIKLTPGVIVFPSAKMQEQARALSHLNLVLSQIPGNMLQGLQSDHSTRIELAHNKNT
jgi:hypothetical protein